MNSGSNTVINHATFGVISWLEQRNDVTDIQVMDCQPAQPHMLNSWEEGNGCKLPNDLKQFYLTSNGLLIQWSIWLKGIAEPIGLMEVNPIESLNRVLLRLNKHDDVTLDDLEIPCDEEQDKDSNGYHQPPRFDDKIFELSSDGKHGKVCLVYGNDAKDSPNVWLLDRALQWHYLAKTFQQYFRMLISHIGIQGWQYLYTDIGLSPESKQWFSYCLPHKLLGRIHSNDASLTASSNEKTTDINKIDFSVLFKQKTSDKKKTSEQARQKINQQQPGKSKGNSSSRTIQKNTKTSSGK